MTYRDELDAARARKDALLRELETTRARLSELEPLSEQARELERLLAEAERDITSARARTDVPLLSRVRVAAPCPARWDDMVGDAHVRHCGQCDKDVYDLSSLTRAQAESLLRERGESLCVRFYKRADGTIMTADCPVGVRKRKVRLAVLAGATALAGAVGMTASAVGLVISADEPHGCSLPPSRPDDGYAMMGEVSMPEPPHPPVRNVSPPPVVDEGEGQMIQGGLSLRAE